MWRRIIVLVAATFFVGRTDAAEPVAIRFAAPPGILNLIDFDFVGAVNRQLDGIARIVVQDASNSLSAVRESGADIALIPSSAFADSKAGGLALFDSAFQFDNLSDVFDLQRGALGDALLASVSGEGLVGLGFWNVATTHILGQPKLDLQAFKGLKVISSTRRASLQALGAVPIAIPDGDLYAALTTGVANAADVSPNFALTSGLYKTGKYLTEQPLTARVYLMVASEASWSKYSLQIQSVLAEQTRLAAARLNEIVPKRESIATAELKERGVQVVSLSSDDLKLVRANAKASPVAERDRLAALSLRTMEQERLQPSPHGRDLDPTPRPKGQTSLFFVTDRALQNNTDPNLRFGAQRGDIVYGAMRIDHGNDRPNAGPADGARITDIAPFKDENDFATELVRRVQAHPKGLFIYVHGYNNSFRDSAESAALLLADLKFEGVGLVFSWPSDGIALRYPHDEQEEEVSRRTFLSLLQTLRRVGIKPIHLLAHSMGNRVVTGALELMALGNREQEPFLHHLILAAPDIYAARFTQLIPSMNALSRKTTLYVSSADQALTCSQLLHEGARAGQGGSGRIVRQELVTVDVTKAETMSFQARIASYLPPAEMARWLLYDACRAGHSYITRNFSVVSDLHALVTYDALPEQRILLNKQITPSHWYWEMQRAAR